jgi:hypothetical protein
MGTSGGFCREAGRCSGQQVCGGVSGDGGKPARACVRKAGWSAASRDILQLGKHKRRVVDRKSVMVQPPGQSYLRDIIVKMEGGVERREAGRREREARNNSLQVKLNAEYEVLGGYLVNRAPTGRAPSLVSSRDRVRGASPPASSLQRSFLFLPQTQRRIDLQSASTSIPPDHL